jgi:hypothetical protein
MNPFQVAFLRTLGIGSALIALVGTPVLVVKTFESAQVALESTKYKSWTACWNAEMGKSYEELPKNDLDPSVRIDRECGSRPGRWMRQQ